MPMSPSALSAALAGGPQVAPPAVKRHELSDAKVFPCLSSDAAVRMSVMADSDDVEEQILLQSGVATVHHPALLGYVPAGSAKTAESEHEGKALADYDLNPFSRRSGQEVFPSGEGVGSLPKGSLKSNFLTEAHIKGLPRPLPAHERQKRQEMSCTPTKTNMASLPKEMFGSLGTSTAAGAAMRRAALSGSVIAFITAGYSGKRFIYERAKALGVRSIVIDGPDSWAQVMEKQGVIEKFVPVDFSEADAVFNNCYQALMRSSQEVGPLDAVVSFCEIAQGLCARLTEKLGLPGNPATAVDNARNKYLTRSMMAKAGLPTPLHMRVVTQEDLERSAAHVGFPCVIKPTEGAGSIGVIRCNDIAQLRAAYTRVVHDLRHAKVDQGAIHEGEEGDEAGEGNAESWIKIELMVEEYLDGDEVDVDLVLCNGQPTFGNITDNWPTIEPYFNETGSNCPSVLPRAAQEELMNIGVRSLQVLGFQIGVFHVEAKYTSRGPRLIEINCRMGGGCVRDMNLLVWGVDMVDEHLISAVGLPVRPHASARPIVNVAEFTINAKKTGTLVSNDYLTEWQNKRDVIYAIPLVQPGSHCVSVQDGLPTWVCEFMVQKPTVQEAIAYMKEIEATLSVPIK